MEDAIVRFLCAHNHRTNPVWKVGNLLSSNAHSRAHGRTLPQRAQPPTHTSVGVCVRCARTCSTHVRVPSPKGGV